jgi:hypothetical protein
MSFMPDGGWTANAGMAARRRAFILWSRGYAVGSVLHPARTSGRSGFPWTTSGQRQVN